VQVFRKSAGLIASILVAGMGALLLFSGMPLIGIPLFFGGLALAIWQGITLVQNRPDPYDLSRLWETEPAPEDEPDEDWGEDKSLGFCHNCGHAVPEPYARCPECGTTVR
jgi:uncharacterized paraquat-inducible protein A